MPRPSDLLRAYSRSPAGCGRSSGGYRWPQDWWAGWPDRGSGPQPHRFWWMARRAATSAAGADSDSRGAAIAGDDDEPPVQRRRRAEAVLLFHRGPIHLRKLATLAALADATEARTRIRELNELYDRTGSALRVEEVAGGHQLLTRAALAPWLRRMKHVPPPVQLGGAAMETLAIIAYRQPVLRADIEAIRGVACGELVRQLMQKDLVRIAGRSEELGRPYLYATTAYFLQIFGLKNAGSLPAVAGASIRDDSEDTLANSEVLSQAPHGAAPIELPINVDLPPSALTPSDVVTPKESDVSIATGRVVIDEASQWLIPDPNAAAQRPAPAVPEVVAVDEDEDEDYFDDEDEDEDDVWEDDEDEDADEDDEELEDEWEEVGDEDEAEVDDAEEDEAVEIDDEDEDDLDDAEDEDEDDGLTEEEDEDEWDDDDEDESWEEEDEEDEEWD